ncbi:MAG: beta-ketoacyl-ACP synthase II [Puniceicoccales bacterium]|jgi:3-oxoacyl-[acyl-carrier-protein] synthase II|nr:beta-ketoacyl-ACP synthase II [Puniceicoccales bacterium]
MSESHRIVVTGLGSVTSLGHTASTLWDNLIAGKSGIERIASFDPAIYSCQVGAEVKNFNPEDYMDVKDAKRSDRFTHFAVAATQNAIQDAEFDLKQFDPFRVGVIIGSGIGGIDTIQKQTARFHNLGALRVSPFMIPSLICNMASGIVAIQYGFKGPNFSAVTACSSSAHTIGEAYHMLKLGKADAIFAGGSEAALVGLSFAGFCMMKAMSTHFNGEPERASRPFDAQRDGFVMGEGAGIVLLETLESALARKAKIYCEVIGYAANCDAYHITSPDPEGSGLANCLKNLLHESGLQPTDVDYINAHGTSTEMNDKTETFAIKRVFKGDAKKIKISSTKSMTGHLLGAVGGIEAIVCAKVIETGIIPPTINYENPDPECDLDYVPNRAIRQNVNVAISENLGFGGHNAALMFRKYS